MHRNRLTTCLTVVFICHLISGCVKVGPDYVRPAPVAPREWQAPINDGLSVEQPDPQALAEWWTTLNDPLLTGFIHQAIAGNLDLRQARARLSEARAKRDGSGAGLFPSLNVNGAITKSRSSEERGGGTESNVYSSGFDAGWELDLFGGVRRSVEAAQAQEEASREDLRNVLISLLSEVALNYIEALTYQARLRIAEENLAAQQETFALTQARYQSGLATDLAVQQARYLEAGTRAQIPNLRTGFLGASNRLAVLLGREPGSLNDQLKKPGSLPVIPPAIAVGIPADTLNRRPDIRKAERQLAAQTAQVGVATAELYPSLRLSGSVGLEALSSERLFNSTSRTYSIGPGFSWPIFDAGAIRANIRLQSSLQEEALAKFEATVLSALEEVENALVAYAQEQERNQALKESADAAGQASMLAGIQYSAGLINFSEVLDARRSLLSYQDQLVQSSGTMTANLVRLYKAIGGGWTTLIPEPLTTNREH
jgi:NodT family efflux transporter outer membrane factor (OMF) lipoprotein